jgi:hypothetical protein
VGHEFLLLKPVCQNISYCDEIASAGYKSDAERWSNGRFDCCVTDAKAIGERQAYNGRYHDADEMHVTALASLQGEFATLLDTAQVLQRMHPPSMPQSL